MITKSEKDAMGLISFPSRAAMAARLADVIEMQLARAIAERGAARLAVSGGSTPAALYEALAVRGLDWSVVTATLVDERWTPPGAEGSNETFVGGTLGTASGVRIVGLWSDAPSPAEAAPALNESLTRDWAPFDAVVLGMGDDGHTASWFPKAQGLETALKGSDKVCAVRAIKSAVTGDLVDRMTLTLSALADARFICLLTAGDAKRAAFDRAAAEGPAEEAPVRAILKARSDLWACWAP